jgi:spore coat protein A
MLNGCNSRFLGLSLSNGAPFTVIGTDLGLLPAPVSRTHLLLGPGERYDVVVDFAGYPAGTQVVLANDAPAMYPGEPGVGVIPNVMRFDVVAGPGHVAPIPATLRAVAPIDTSEAVLTRDFTLSKGSDPCAGSVWTINGLGWDDVTEYPVLGTTEIWRFINESGMSHPMHMHLVQFQVLDRQPFARVGGQIVPTGPRVPPDASAAGWKDTAPVGPGEMLRVIARFEDYAGAYAYHCHMLEHEDNEMMRQFQTVAGADRLGARHRLHRDLRRRRGDAGGQALFAGTGRGARRGGHRGRQRPGRARLRGHARYAGVRAGRHVATLPRAYSRGHTGRAHGAVHRAPHRAHACGAR